MPLSHKHFEVEGDSFTRITIGLASPEAILGRSHGEVIKPETINYRSYKPEKDGLFSERIFGPTKDWECFCGKYRGIRYKGIICDRCGVEITRKDVRRKRMGHIELAVPIVHIWFFKSPPSKIGNILGYNTKDLERVIYYEAFAVIQPGKTSLQPRQILTDAEHNAALDEVGAENDALRNDDPKKFIALMGGQAIVELLKRADVRQLSHDFRQQVLIETSVQRKTELIKRLRIIESFMLNGGPENNRPEWMVLKTIPVVPPDLRPLLPLDGGRFATSDLNDLYRRVIIRNNRLRRLMEVNAPDVILRNEKRMLQESVDSLFDNGRKSVAMRSDGNRPLKSLSDNLRGKQGRFRYNLLGKRVDYSGRSVIVVGPELKLHECGLPKDMAVELFKPFVIRKLIERDYAKTVKSAKRMVERKLDCVWELLEEIMQDHPVLLNRAPTLHRLGIQGFQPILIEGRAIRLHPLVCAAFNADFDGDQMAVHIPLSYEAQIEARLLMMSPRNIMHPANGKPIAVPSQDMVLGCYYITKMRPGARGEGKVFSGAEEAVIAVELGKVDISARVKVLADGQYLETTVGRVMFNEILPKQMLQKGHYFNELITKKRLEEIVANIYNEMGFDGTAKYLDKLKELGFKHATRGGLSISLNDVEIPPDKDKLIMAAQKRVDEIQSQYEMGLITDGERYNMIIDTWTHTTVEVAESMFKHMRNSHDGFNPLYMMADSGARGSKEQIRQLAGMRGLMAKPQKTMTGQKGEIIESPITANFKEGLSVLEYFISTHGARKGLADTALKTADAGYLTRRLVDVAQDVIISERDCGTLRGIVVEAAKEGEEVSEQLFDRIIGRVLAEDVYHPLSGEMILSANTLIKRPEAQIIASSGIAKVRIRSVLTCESVEGVCSLCYGINMTNNKLVDIGEAVGVIAAQSIGEPGTQLTLRTFHIGGTASLIEAESQVAAKGDGRVHYENMEYIKRSDGTSITLRRNGIIKLIDENNRIVARYAVPYGATLLKDDQTQAKTGEVIFTWDPYSAVILANHNGTIQFHDIKENVSVIETVDEATGQRKMVIIESKDRRSNPHMHILDAKGKSTGQYILPIGALLMVTDGKKVRAGDALVKIPREASKTKDITGGLPRVAELFEARKPKEPAIVSEIDGIVKFGQLRRGVREISVTPTQPTGSTDESKIIKHLIPIGRHILVHDGEYVTAGERLIEGSVSPQDILAILGPGKVQEYVVNEIQDVYRLQGVRINDKHIEVIVRQMMQKVRVEDPGDTLHLEGDQTDYHRLLRENRKIATKVVVLEPGDSRFEKGQLVEKGLFNRELRRITKADGNEPEARPAKPAVYKQILLGITQASLSTESFISAASFQETTRVLTDAAIAHKTDVLKGLKENVIMGHLIPAGTGLTKYRTLLVENPEGEDEAPVIRSRDRNLGAEIEAAALVEEEIRRGGDVDEAVEVAVSGDGEESATPEVKES